MSSTSNDTVNTDPFGLWMAKPTKPGGQVWYIYNTDFNNDPQVFTESVSNEYLVHNIEDADGTRFSISASDTFKTYISTSTGYNPSQNITDQQEMSRRGYMQNAQDWRNVEITGQFVVFKEPSADDFITIGVRTGKHTGNGAPTGCTGSAYLFEVNMRAGGLVRVRKESWNVSIHNWLSTLASGFDATKVCGWSFKVLCYNSQDGNSVNVEMWLAKDNDNRFVKILSGQDTGQINTDATVCNCTAAGQAITWGGPFIMLQGNTGTFGFKNLSIREIEGFGATLPPVDPGPPTPPPTGGGGGGGTGSGGGGGSTGGGGGVPVDLTPVLTTPKTSYVEYGGGPQFNPLEFHFIFAGAAWNQAPSTTSGGGGGGGSGTPVTTTIDPILSPPQSNDVVYNNGQVFTSATVHFIFWGSGWNTQTLPWSKNDVMAAIQKVFQSEYFSGLIQYGTPNDKFNRKPKIGSIATNTTYTPVNNFTALDLRNVVVDSMNRGQVPDKGVLKTVSPGTVIDHHIYYVIGAHNCFPASSYVNAASFHDVTNESSDDEYLVVAYTNNMDYVNGNTTNMKYMTYGMTHEMAEAITDPLLDGWVHDDGSGNLDEIADACSVEYTVNGVICSGYLSNEDNACIAPVVTPSWVKCSTGYTYDPATQTCKKVSITAAATTTTVQVADPVFDPPKASEFRNQGGMFTNPLQVYFIWWGSTYNSGTNKTTRDNVVADQIKIFDSAYYDACLQYSMARRPVFKKSVVNTTYAPVDNFNYQHVTNVISDSYNHGLVPVPVDGASSNIVYVVISDPSMDYESPGAGGEHRYAYFLPGRTNYLNDPHYQQITVIYKAVPGRDNLNEAITHEMVEDITDPAAGWILKPDSKFYSNGVEATYGFEMVDVCEPPATRRKTVNGVAVAGYWSDEDNACVAPTSKPGWIKCPSGYTYDNATQTCTRTVTTPVPTPVPPPSPSPVPQPTPEDTGGIVANTTLKTQTQNAITSIFNSTYFTGMYQYGLSKKPTIGSFTVNTTAAPVLPNKFSQAQLEAVINDSIAKGQVPAASSTKKNIVHFVITPPRIFYSTTSASSNHYAVAGDSTNTWYKIIAFATLTNNFDDLTREIAYAAVGTVAQQINDNGGRGYHMKATTGNTTVDSNIQSYGTSLPAVCRGDTTNNKINTTITVAKYWSDQDGACIIPPANANPTPWATCHTGAVFDNTTQACKLQPTSGGGGTTPPGTGGGQGYKVALANASDDDGHIPANAVDGKLDTRWSAFGKGQFLRLDLGAAKKVDKIKIAWYQGDKRSNSFEITTAETTGGAYTSQFQGNSVKGSTALQDYAIHPANPVRYIRIIGNGNSDNDWVSISEVEVWGPDVASTTPGTGTGGDPGSGGTTPGGDTGGGTGTTHPEPDTPVTEAGYNFFDTSFSVDYHKIGLCNPVE